METTTTVHAPIFILRAATEPPREMADHFNFNADQRQRLFELLCWKSQYMVCRPLRHLLGDDAIVAVALSQVGNIGGEPYWTWYGFESHVEWCACFVNWCAAQCGYIDTGVCPKFAGCGNGVQWFRDRGQWLDGSVEPAPGMIIFFDWDQRGRLWPPRWGGADHVGIVERVKDGTIYTVEGNNNNFCRQDSPTR